MTSNHPPAQDRRVIIVTGASQGLGAAIATALFAPPLSCNLILTARSAAALEALAATLAAASTIPPGAPDYRAVVVAGDAQESETGRACVAAALREFGRLDGLVLNHGIVEPVARVEDVEFGEWKRCLDVNFFSMLYFVQAVPTLPHSPLGCGSADFADVVPGCAQIQPALPHLRDSPTGTGRVLFTSSGAAVSHYGAWGAYGSSKAALNHLCGTLAKEEGPRVLAMAVRPGMVDTAMQTSVREVHGAKMLVHEAAKFERAHEKGTLVRPEVVGAVMARLVVDGGAELNGKFFSWDGEEAKAYR